MGKSALTAEALMRSRYTAYVIRDVQYLLHSWHDSTRPKTLELEHDTQWIRLNILEYSENRVEFVAIYRVNGKAHKLRENSRFVREDGCWYYLDGRLE